MKYTLYSVLNETTLSTKGLSWCFLKLVSNSVRLWFVVFKHGRLYVHLYTYMHVYICTYSYLYIHWYVWKICVYCFSLSMAYIQVEIVVKVLKYHLSTFPLLPLSTECPSVSPTRLSCLSEPWIYGQFCLTDFNISKSFWVSFCCFKFFKRMHIM